MRVCNNDKFQTYTGVSIRLTVSSLAAKTVSGPGNEGTPGRQLASCPIAHRPITSFDTTTLQRLVLDNSKDTRQFRSTDQSKSLIQQLVPLCKKQALSSGFCARTWSPEPRCFVISLFRFVFTSTPPAGRRSSRCVEAEEVLVVWFGSRECGRLGGEEGLRSSDDVWSTTSVDTCPCHACCTDSRHDIHMWALDCVDSSGA